MGANTRLKLITETVQSNKRVSVTELSKKCNVTEETIRKDLSKLESDGVLTRVHGGAVLNEQNQLAGIQFDQRKLIRASEKKIIAGNVQFLLTDGVSIFADGSSTVSEALATMSDDTDIMVISNSTNLFFDLLHKKARVISTGGLFNRKHLSLQGNVAKETLSKYHVDYALISCKAVDLERGIQDSDEAEAEIKKCMIEHADKVILLVDNTKIDKNSLIHLMNLDKISFLITDKEPSQEWMNYCYEHDIELVY